MFCLEPAVFSVSRAVCSIPEWFSITRALSISDSFTWYFMYNSAFFFNRETTRYVRQSYMVS